MPGCGSYVRALLPVMLADGFSVRFGLWLEVDDDDFLTAYDAWWSQDYLSLRLVARLANAVAPWGLLGALVSAAAREPEDLPVCASLDPALSAVLDGLLPHAEVWRAHFD